MKKNRQNFTIDEKISEKFKQLCDHTMVNMSRVIENYMVEYIEKHKFDTNLKNLFDNLDAIKNIALANFNEGNDYSFSDLKLSDYEDEVMKSRKLITRMIHCSNIIAGQLKYGAANTCILSEKYYNYISKYLVGGTHDRSVKYIGNIKIIKNNNIGDFILCIKLLSDEDINIMKLCESDIDLSKQYVGFNITD